MALGNSPAWEPLLSLPVAAFGRWILWFDFPSSSWWRETADSSPRPTFSSSLMTARSCVCSKVAFPWMGLHCSEWVWSKVRIGFRGTFYCLSCQSFFFIFLKKLNFLAFSLNPKVANWGRGESRGGGDRHRAFCSAFQKRSVRYFRSFKCQVDSLNQGGPCRLVIRKKLNTLKS